MKKMISLMVTLILALGIFNPIQIVANETSGYKDEFDEHESENEQYVFVNENGIKKEMTEEEFNNSLNSSPLTRAPCRNHKFESNGTSVSYRCFHMPSFVASLWDDGFWGNPVKYYKTYKCWSCYAGKSEYWKSKYRPCNS